MWKSPTIPIDPTCTSDPVTTTTQARDTKRHETFIWLRLFCWNLSGWRRFSSSNRVLESTYFNAHTIEYTIFCIYHSAHKWTQPNCTNKTITTHQWYNALVVLVVPLHARNLQTHHPLTSSYTSWNVSLLFFFCFTLKNLLNQRPKNLHIFWFTVLHIKRTHLDCTNKTIGKHQW